MENYITTIILVGAVFMAVVVPLFGKAQLAKRMCLVAGIIAALGGIVLYSYSYLIMMEGQLAAVVRAIVAVCCMFVAEIDTSVLGEVPMFQSVWLEVLFWVIQLLALYATVSAALTTFGASALRRLRVRMARQGELVLIYGVNSNSLEYGNALLEQKNVMVVFVDDQPELPDVDAIAMNGCIWRPDSNAMDADEKFLRSVGVRPGKRKITLYALKSECAANVNYAKSFLKALEARCVPAEQTSLVIHAREDSNASMLQVVGDRYGYGFVSMFQESGLAARLLVRAHPPCKCMTFDAEGKATESFEALVVGFGQLGQAVLKSIVMNSQFVGSTFRAAVFSPDCQSVYGYFYNSLLQMQKQYDITFHPYDARSSQMYDFLSQRGRYIKYVALCTGSDKLNQEIADELTSFFALLGMKCPVYQCSYKGIKSVDMETMEMTLHKLYEPGLLDVRQIDSMAMIVNHYYQGGNNTPLENWMNCDYFSRMSCRAFGDFIEAVLRAAGKTEEQALANEWFFSDSMMENLGKMEHDRWCAFHYCMGFSPMGEEEYAQRTAEYSRQMAQDGKATIRIGKNMAGRTHACLIDWDELDELSARENAITGKAVNYKSMDMENIRIVPDLLMSKKAFFGN